jgi:hypothetical protein
MTQLVLPLHECAAKPLQDVVESIVDSVAAEAATDLAAAKAATDPDAEPLHFTADPAGSVLLWLRYFAYVFRFKSLA